MAQTMTSARRAIRPMVLGLEPRPMLSGTMPGNLGPDVAQIAQNENPSIDIELLPWSGLMLNGGTPWTSTQPSSFGNQPQTTNTTTSTNGGLTTTLTVTGSVTASTTGYPGGGSGSSSGGGSGSSSGGGSGGSWSESYDGKTSQTQTITGTDANGMTVNQVENYQYELVWTASGAGDGVTSYTVKEDVTVSNTDGLTGPGGGSYNLQTGDSHDGHLTANGTVDSGGNVTGNFTYQGDIGTTFALDDASGSPSSQAPSYSVNYNASCVENLDESGTLGAGAVGNGTVTVTSSETGTISNSDGQGGVDGASRNDSDTVTANYAGSQTSSASSPTSGTVSASGPATPLQVPKGRNTVYVIDNGDTGWSAWSPAQKAAYAAAHGINPSTTPSGNVTTGTQFVAALNPPNGYISGSSGLNQVVGDLGLAVIQSGGGVDVLVIGDHGGPGVQNLGNDALTPQLAPRTPGGNPGTSLLDEVAGFVRSGGTLVLTGCEVFGLDQFGNPTIGDWQQYATAHNITIMGSAGPTNFSSGSVTGVWITLVPGGTAPTVGK